MAFPGISTAKVEVLQKIPDGESVESLLEKGKLLIDLGGGQFDHHMKTPKTTASKLISSYLEVDTEPSLSKLLEYAERDDFYGKGTMSTDALDRAFGLSGLVSALNKTNVDKPESIVDIVLPLIKAHHEEEIKRTDEMPKEFEKIKSEGKFSDFVVRQRDKNLKVIILESGNVGLPGFLRSRMGGAYDVVLQRLTTNHVNILTRPTKRIDLRALVVKIREMELDKSPYVFTGDKKELAVSGRIDELPQWYYDPATNSIQNGGVNPKDIEPTKIDWDAWQKIVEIGLSESEWKPISFKTNNISTQKSDEIIYTGIFITEESKKIIEQKFPCKFPKKFIHHITLSFRPTSTETATLPLGIETEIEVVGYVSDGMAEALVVKVDPFLSIKPNQHITISTADGVPPVYSNKLLEATKHEEIEPFKVKGVVGFYTNKGIVTKR